MEWWILALAILLPSVLISGIFLFVLRAQRRQIRQMLEQAQAAEVDNRNAIWAGATVLAFQQDGADTRNPDEVLVRLQMRVTGHGGEPYIAAAVWQVDLVHLPQIQQGAELSVKVNRENPALVYPNMPGMRAVTRRIG